MREQLFELAISSLDETRRNASIGHLLLRILDWPIRYSRTAEVEFWLSQSDRLLPASWLWAVRVPASNSFACSPNSG